MFFSFAAPTPPISLHKKKHVFLDQSLQESVTNKGTSILCRFPGGGPGLGKEARGKPARRTNNRDGDTKKAVAKPKVTRGKANTGSNSGRRIITESYTSQVTLSDFVEA